MKNLKNTFGLMLIVLLLSGTAIAQPFFQVSNQENNNNEDEPGLIQDVNNFLSSTSPAFLIILGIILIVGSGVAKIIGYILIVYAIIRLLFTLL